MKFLRKKIVPYVVFAIVVLLLFLGRGFLSMNANLALTTIGEVGFCSNGNIVLTDQGKTAIEILNENNRLVQHLSGEGKDGFYYADLVFMEGDTLYVADTTYNVTEKSRICRRLLSLHGKERKVLWEQEYEVSGKETNRILDFQYYQGIPFFLLETEYGLELYGIDEKNDRVWLKDRYYCGDKINDACIDLESGIVAVTVSRGFIRLYRPQIGKWETVGADGRHRMPSCISIGDGRVFFSDLYDGKVYDFPLDLSEEIQEFLTPEGTTVSIAAGNDGRVLIGSTQGLYLVKGADVTFLTRVRYQYYMVTMLVRTLYVILTINILWIVLKLKKRFHRITLSEDAIRSVMVIMAVVFVASFVAYTLMNKHYEQEEDNLIEDMKLFAELMSEQTDARYLAEMVDEESYGTSAYKTLRDPMDQMIQKAYAGQKQYYYSLYRVKDEVSYLLNSADDVMCGQPYAGRDADYFRKVKETGSSYALNRVDADGNWIYILVPVREGDDIEAVLEVGMDMSLQNMEKRRDVLDTIFNVICTSAVVFMLIMELVILLSFMEKRKQLLQTDTLDLPGAIPVRALIFFTNAADSLQDAFIAILCAQLYKGQLPVPDSVAVALPLSAQLLMLALFSSFMGVVGEKKGETRVMKIGFAVQCAGCICCAAIGSYWGILLGKMLIGMGMGTIYVNCYAIAAKGKNDESSAKAFAEITAGSLSGVTIGSGIASVFLAIGGWKLVYVAGAVLLGISLVVLLIVGRDMKYGVDEQKPVEKKEEKSFGIKAAKTMRFLFNKRIIGFFILILLPFMMSLSYREYFLPLMAGNDGVSEIVIGRFYLLCGVVFLYLGPKVSDFLVKHLSTLTRVYLACGLIGVTMLLYVLWPSMETVFAGMIIQSFVISFAYGCLYTFFGSLPESQKFGEAKSMGVYTVFESVGSMVGPLAYGVLLSFGDRLGMGIFCAVILIFMVLYATIVKMGKKA